MQSSKSDASGGFLIDEELKEVCTPDKMEAGSDKFIYDCSLKVSENWKLEDSQIQPASIDLYAGEYYRPGKNTSKDGSISLDAGEMCVIITKETLKLPSNIMGLVFSPTSLTMRGILMPTAGHIDPGFEGKLRLLAINMGNNQYHFNRNTKVATVVLYKLSKDCSCNYKERQEKHIEEPKDIAARLARDFASIHDMAKKAAKQATSETGRRLMWQIIGAIVAAVLAAILAGSVTQMLINYISNLQRLRERVYKLEYIIRHENLSQMEHKPFQKPASKESTPTAQQSK